ncbi:hypothetical protein [Massilia sp.]|uniref:hypothetical protein n=1 Tax=Massilia sp. TaxID=1882437 RepID=UPI0039189B43
MFKPSRLACACAALFLLHTGGRLAAVRPSQAQDERLVLAREDRAFDRLAGLASIRVSGAYGRAPMRVGQRDEAADAGLS